MLKKLIENNFHKFFIINYFLFIEGLILSVVLFVFLNLNKLLPSLLKD